MLRYCMGVAPTQAARTGRVRCRVNVSTAVSKPAAQLPAVDLKYGQGQDQRQAI